MICNCTPSSVCGPLKQPQIVSTIRSISRLPGVVVSGVLPVKCPYAINFWGSLKAESNFASQNMCSLFYPFINQGVLFLTFV